MKDAQKILILCGNEAPAVAAANVYASLLGDRELRFAEERVISLGRSLSFSLKRLKSKGLFSLLGCYAYYLHTFIRGEKTIPRRYRPVCRTADFSTDAAVARLVDEFRPDLAIIGFCGVFSPEFLRRFTCPVINVHPGINPRYRGLGNIWAFYEKNPGCTGFTIHEVDEGMDTGRRIDVGRLDFSGTDFEDMDILAATRAAERLAALIRGRALPHIPEEFKNLESRFYGVPTLGQYCKARRNYRLLRAGES